MEKSTISGDYGRGPKEDSWVVVTYMIRKMKFVDNEPRRGDGLVSKIFLIIKVNKINDHVKVVSRVSHGQCK